MSTPSTEATGSRRTPLPQVPLTTPQQVRVKIDCLLDCTRRALDGLAVDADHQPNWYYVAGQLKAAGHFAAQAEELATCAGMKVDAATDEANAALSNLFDQFPNANPSNGPYEGGA